MIPTSHAQMAEWLRTLQLCAWLLAPQANQAHFKRVQEVIAYIEYQQAKLKFREESDQRCKA